MWSVGITSAEINSLYCSTPQVMNVCIRTYSILILRNTGVLWTKTDKENSKVSGRLVSWLRA